MCRLGLRTLPRSPVDRLRLFCLMLNPLDVDDSYKFTRFFATSLSDFDPFDLHHDRKKNFHTCPCHTGNISATMVLTFTDGPRNGKPSIEHGEGDSFDPKW